MKRDCLFHLILRGSLIGAGAYNQHLAYRLRCLPLAHQVCIFRQTHNSEVTSLVCAPSTLRCVDAECWPLYAYQKYFRRCTSYRSSLSSFRLRAATSVITVTLYFDRELCSLIYAWLTCYFLCLIHAFLSTAEE